MKYLISAHYSSPISFNKEDCKELIEKVNSDEWDYSSIDERFLTSFYNKLYKIGIIPENVNFK